MQSFLAGWKPKGPLRMPVVDAGAVHHGVPAVSSAEVLVAWAEEAPAAQAPAATAAAAAGTESTGPPSKKAKTERKVK